MPLMYVLIAAAGQGKRMGHNRNKLLLTLQGRPILAWTLLRVFQAQPTWVGVMAQPADWPEIEAMLTELAPPVPVQLIPGGGTPDKPRSGRGFAPSPLGQKRC